MSEIYQPPYELWKTDHGVDGWDAKRWLVATFSSVSKAEAYLKKCGYTFPQYSAFYHEQPEKRNTMGAISYEIRSAKLQLEHDPE